MVVGLTNKTFVWSCQNVKPTTASGPPSFSRDDKGSILSLMSALNKGGGVNMLVAYWLERSEKAHAQHGGGFGEQCFYCQAFNS